MYETRTQVRMNRTQHNMLSNADPDTGKIGNPDMRTVKALARRGWVERRAHRPKRRRREVVEWFVTAAGAAALAAAEVVDPPARPDWRGWDVTTVRRGVEYVAHGHTLRRPVRGLGWWVVCPARPDDSIAHADTLAEAVDLLAAHVYRGTCGPRPVDLDALTAAPAVEDGVSVDWEAEGRRAFEAGEPAAPWLNAAVRDAVSGLPVGGGAVAVMGAFSAGWHEANMAAPVD